MDTQELSPENFAERVIWFSITRTYLIYLFGGLYILAPAIAWVLLFHLGMIMLRQTEKPPADQRISIPIGVGVWVIAMLVMELALLVGHVDYNLDLGQIIKSTIGWAKGWALIAIFPLIGCLNVRPELIYKATAIVCLHTLLIMPFLIVAYYVGLPQDLYVSPLQIVGGPGPEYFTVTLYGINTDGTPRWRLFTPCGPALGFVANFYFIFAMQLKGSRWFYIGIAGSVLMCLVSKSRLALVSIAVVALTSWVIGRLTKLPVLAFLAGSSVIAGINAPAISQAFDEFNQNFSEARADSSRVRSALGRIALISIILILFLYAFGENLEILAYLFWPALVVLGAAFKERAIQPLISS